jgi:hypothetical protein
VACGCRCHLKVKHTYVARSGDLVYVLSDGTTERVGAET